MVQKATQNSSANTIVPEDKIAESLKLWLERDSRWNGYLANKKHMTGHVAYVMTDTMARFIASEAYGDITS